MAQRFVIAKAIASERTVGLEPEPAWAQTMLEKGSDYERQDRMTRSSSSVPTMRRRGTAIFLLLSLAVLAEPLSLLAGCWLCPHRQNHSCGESQGTPAAVCRLCLDGAHQNPAPTAVAEPLEATKHIELQANCANIFVPTAPLAMSQARRPAFALAFSPPLTLSSLTSPLLI